MFNNKPATELHPVHGTDVKVTEPKNEKKYPHYFKRVPFTHIDVYRVLELYDITNPAIAHAIKKLLVAGGRGAKNVTMDVKEAIVSCERFLEMRQEEIDLEVK